MSNQVNPRDCLFSADLELKERSSETAKTAPFSMVARSGLPINHHFWGPIVHDNNGAQHKKRIPIDFNHDVNEIIGFGNKIGINENGDLQISGFLTPYKDSDRATEILAKSEMGVPWEASINFAGDMVLEKVAEGDTVEVNGHEFEGPMTVVREWQLRGVAVCPYGYDSSTSTQFSNESQISITYVEKDETMSEELKSEELEVAAEEKVEELEAPIDELKADDKEMEDKEEKEEEELSSEDSEESVEEDKDAEDKDELSVEAPAEAPAELSNPGDAYMQLFGEQVGALYFAKGVSLEDAKNLEIERLQKEVAELSARVVETATSGEESPVGFSASDAQTKLQGLPISIL